jgi:single-strand DNA-binding protein
MKKIIITGNVARDPEIRADQQGNSYVTFSVGVTVGNKQNPKTDWVDVSCNGRLLDIARNYIRKGSKLLIEGFPAVRAYINKENKPIGTLQVFAHHIELLGAKEDNVPIDQDSQLAFDLPEPKSTHSGNITLKSDEIPF